MKLKDARLKIQFSRNDLAMKLRCTGNTILMWENGSTPTKRNRGRIARFFNRFGIEIEFGGEDEK